MLFFAFLRPMSSLADQFRAAARQIHPAVVAIRRHLHAHPELSFEEKETADFVRQQLENLGLEVKTGIGGYGLTALIVGTAGPSDKVIALRADMDALPILEQNEAAYCSTRPGLMHACGHDMHTASLLGAARLLLLHRNQFAGTIKLIFQPGEEKTPGGASLMIRDGVLKSPDIQTIIGQHVQPSLEVGKVGIRSGMYMASSDELYFRVRGKGGHAAQPWNLIDPVVVAAQIITALQQVVSRSDPRIPSVLSIGKVEAKGVTNVVPEEVYMEGTFRTFSEPWRAEAKQRIARIATHTAEAFGCTCEVTIQHGYPVLFNDEALTARTRRAMEAYLGAENVVELDLWMASEDFAFYTHEIPGCFYRIGVGNAAKGIVHPVHTPRFDIDEESLAVAPGLMAWLAVCELEG